MAKRALQKISDEGEKQRIGLLQHIAQLSNLPHPELVAKMVQFSGSFQAHLGKSLAAMDLKLAKMQQVSENVRLSTEKMDQSAEIVRAEAQAAFQEVRAEVMAQRKTSERTQEAFQNAVKNIQAETQQSFLQIRSDFENSLLHISGKNQWDLQEIKAVIAAQRETFSTRLGLLEHERPLVEKRIGGLERAISALSQHPILSAPIGTSHSSVIQGVGAPVKVAPPVVLDGRLTEIPLKREKVGAPENTPQDSGRNLEIPAIQGPHSDWPKPGSVFYGPPPTYQKTQNLKMQGGGCEADQKKPAKKQSDTAPKLVAQPVPVPPVNQMTATKMGFAAPVPPFSFDFLPQMASARGAGAPFFVDAQGRRWMLTGVQPTGPSPGAGSAQGQSPGSAGQPTGPSPEAGPAQGTATKGTVSGFRLHEPTSTQPPCPQQGTAQPTQLTFDTAPRFMSQEPASAQVQCAKQGIAHPSLPNAGMTSGFVAQGPTVLQPQSPKRGPVQQTQQIPVTVPGFMNGPAPVQSQGPNQGPSQPTQRIFDTPTGRELPTACPSSFGPPENFASQKGLDPFSWATENILPEVRVRGVQVQPAAVQPMGAALAQPEYWSGPLATLLAKDLVKPEFKGNFHDFSIKWKIFLQNVALTLPLTEDQKLMLLAGSLDQGTRLELQRRQELGEKVQYQEFWNWMARRFGGDEQSQLRDELRGLRVQNTGKLTLGAWRDFESKFRLIYSRLENPPEEEAQTLLLQQIPELMRKSILREQQRRDENTPLVRLRNIPGLTLDRVRSLVESAIGSEEPLLVSEVTGGFLIKLFSARSRDLLMLRNCSSLNGGHLVRLSVQEHRFSLDEIFRQIENELRCQEKSDSLGRNWGARGTSQPLDQPREDSLQIFEVKTQESAHLPKAMPAPSSPAVPMNLKGPETKKPSSGAPENRGHPRERDSGSRTPTSSPARSEEPRTSRDSGKGTGHSHRSASTHGKGGRGPPSGGKGVDSGKGKGKGNGGGGPGWSRQASRSPSRDNPCARCGEPDHWVRDCPNNLWCAYCKVGTHKFQNCWYKPQAHQGGEQPQNPNQPRPPTPVRRRSA